MSSVNQLNKNIAEGELVITHIFNAPRELVFKAWTDPQLLKRWLLRKVVRFTSSKLISAKEVHSIPVSETRNILIAGVSVHISK